VGPAVRRARGQVKYETPGSGPDVCGQVQARAPPYRSAPSGERPALLRTGASAAPAADGGPKHRAPRREPVAGGWAVRRANATPPKTAGQHGLADHPKIKRSDPRDPSRACKSRVRQAQEGPDSPPPRSR